MPIKHNRYNSIQIKIEIKMCVDKNDSASKQGC